MPLFCCSASITVFAFVSLLQHWHPLLTPKPDVALHPSQLCWGLRLGLEDSCRSWVHHREGVSGQVCPHLYLPGKGGCLVLPHPLGQGANAVLLLRRRNQPPKSLGVVLQVLNVNHNEDKAELSIRREIILQQDMHCNFSDDILYFFSASMQPTCQGGVQAASPLAGIYTKWVTAATHFIQDLTPRRQKPLLVHRILMNPSWVFAIGISAALLHSKEHIFSLGSVT